MSKPAIYVPLEAEELLLLTELVRRHRNYPFSNQIADHAVARLIDIELRFREAYKELADETGTSN